MGLKTQIAGDNKVALKNGSIIGSPITKEHFSVWLSMFDETTKEVFVKEEAEKIMEKANMIAKSLQMGMFRENF